MLEAGWGREAREIVTYTNQNVREQMIVLSSKPSEAVEQFSKDTMRFYTQIVRGKPEPPSEEPVEGAEEELLAEEAMEETVQAQDEDN
jgi:hypothetical protein